MRSVVSLSLFALALMACQNPTLAVPALTVRADASQTTVSSEQGVVVDVTVFNETRQSARISGGPFAFLEVRDGAGRVVAFGRFEILSMQAYPPRQLATGESAADRAPWHGELSGTTERAAPGTYQVRAAVAVSGGTGGGAYRYSAPITVTLTP